MYNKRKIDWTGFARNHDEYRALIIFNSLRVSTTILPLSPPFLFLKPFHPKKEKTDSGHEKIQLLLEIDLLLVIRQAFVYYFLDPKNVIEFHRNDKRMLIANQDLLVKKEI
jgi:hypothetical protein